MPRRAQRLAILLVDDDELTRRALRRHLGQHDVTEAGSYAAALDSLTRLAYLDVAVTDYNLGDGHTGIEVLGEVMRVFPGARRILMSADIEAIPRVAASSVAHQIRSKTDIGLVKLLANL